MLVSTRIEFNVRYAWQFNRDSLVKLLASIIGEVDGGASVSWSRPCESYMSRTNTQKRCLITIAEKAIVQATGRYPVVSTSGGAFCGKADGRFFASDTTQVVELGVPNATIHQVNEHVHLSDIVTLEDIFTDILLSL